MLYLIARPAAAGSLYVAPISSRSRSFNTKDFTSEEITLAIVNALPAALVLFDVNVSLAGSDNAEVTAQVFHQLAAGNLDRRAEF